MARASSRPPPRARELIAEMVGTGRAERVVRVDRRFVRKSAVLVGGSVLACAGDVCQVSGARSSR